MAQGLDERSLAATRRPDNGGTLQIDLGGVPAGKRAPVEELEIRDDEGSRGERVGQETRLGRSVYEVSNWGQRMSELSS